MLGLGILLARFFGATDYGRIAFLTATFMAIKQLLDLGTSSAFFTFLSRQTRSVAYVGLFWAFFLGKYLLATVVIFTILPADIVDRIWHGEQHDLIALALAATALQFDAWPAAAQMPESQRKTVKVQLIYITALLMQLVLVLGLYMVGELKLKTYLLAIAVLWFAAALLAVNLYEPSAGGDEKMDVRLILNDYSRFCLPIAPFFIVGFLSDFLDRWMLQTWAGSKQQAYLAIAQQISGVSLLITASLIRLFWKEIAEALHRGDTRAAQKIYANTKRSMFFIGAFIAAGIAPWSEEVLSVLFGQEYVSAGAVFVLMMLYSIHQSLGQLEGAFIMASGHTKTGLLFNVVMVPLGPLASYMLLSPELLGGPGLDLGAAGLAIKLVIFQLISVNVLGYLVCRRQSWTYDWKYQFTTIFYLLLLGALGKSIAASIGLTVLPSLIMGALIYTALVAGAMLMRFNLFGIRDSLPKVFGKTLDRD